MNKVILIGSLTRDTEVRYSGVCNRSCQIFLEVDRRAKKDNEQSADFINCVGFGKTAEFAEKYFRKGMRVCVVGRIHNGSYTNRDGQKVYTTDVVVEEHEFTESKGASENNGADRPQLQQKAADS